jgi:polyhydroxyalkanoate synthesis repressor PhaR
MPEKVVLKKYANRRLYDTEKRAFVSLSQVAELVKQGREIEISDDKTGEDVTAFILTQVVLEEVKKKSLLLPVSLLSLMIRYGDSVLSEFFDNYLEQILKNYLTYKSAMDTQFRTWLELGHDFSALTTKAMANFTPSPPWLDIFPEKAPGKKTDKDEGGL